MAIWGLPGRFHRVPIWFVCMLSTYRNPSTLQAVEQWQGKLEGYTYDINAIMSEEKSEAGLRKAEMEAQKVRDKLSLPLPHSV